MAPAATARVAASNNGAPMSPRAGMTRGTSLDRYSRVPKSNALRAAQRFGPNTNVQLRIVTSA